MYHQFRECSWLERIENWQSWDSGSASAYPWNKRRKRGRRRRANSPHLKNLRIAPHLVRRQPKKGG